MKLLATIFFWIWFIKLVRIMWIFLMILHKISSLKSYYLSCTLRKGCVRTLWIRAPYWEREGGGPPAVTKSVS